MTHKNTSSRTALTLLALALGGLVDGGSLFAGPLDPPAGPPVSTLKTLTDAEPRIAVNATNTPGTATAIFLITQPGSYYLTGNITGVANKDGIAIAASGVTLDLNGFDVAGVPNSFSGVVASGVGRTNITVLNGSVRNWTIGVNLGGGLQAANCRVTEIAASGNTGQGIRTGPATTVSNCSATLNGANGISTGTDFTVTGCMASQNATGGIIALDRGTLTKCSVYQNSGIGISVGINSTVSDCIARRNTLDGIQCVSVCVVRNNNCSANGNGGDGAGIKVTGDHNQIEGNHCTGADRGVYVQSGANVIIKNTCSGNTTDWDIVADNLYGSIRDRRATFSSAFSGSNYFGDLDTSDANANFSH